MLKRKTVVMDIEVYRNYFLIMFCQTKNRRTIKFEKFNDSELDIKTINSIMQKYTVITFNGIGYDHPILLAALNGLANSVIKDISDEIIVKRIPAWTVRKRYGLYPSDRWDTIDIMPIAPLMASLKMYGGRMHCEKLQDLPVEPSAIISNSQRLELIKYCGNDIELTMQLYFKLLNAIHLRKKLGKQYGIDLRSKSDAQISEEIIKEELARFGKIAKKTAIPEGTQITYKAPAYLKFDTSKMISVCESYKTAEYRIKTSGHVNVPASLKDNAIIKKSKFTIGEGVYRVGVGGLHSCEKNTTHYSDEEYVLIDFDVAAYYPSIVLRNGYYPKRLGTSFLLVYQELVEKRLRAKAKGDKTINDCLKITINGAFGKLGSKYSILYAPDLMLQVTLTGQLSLLMLIEQFELENMQVVSGNTDGIVVKVPRNRKTEALEIVSAWEFDTGYAMDATEYNSLHSRDVNNYIAVKSSGIKTKGAFADSSLSINPVNEICNTAVKQYLTKKIPVETTIRGCRDITKFITIRTVNGGAIKDGIELGKAIRWYYHNREIDGIYYKTNGNKVPRSDGAIPLLDLPETFPNDIDFQWYIAEANKLLNEIGIINE